jgi:hypothetical protein
VAEIFEAITDCMCNSTRCRYRTTSVMDASLVLVLAGAGGDLSVHLLRGQVVDRHNRLSAREVAG